MLQADGGDPAQHFITRSSLPCRLFSRRPPSLALVRSLIDSRWPPGRASKPAATAHFEATNMQVRWRRARPDQFAKPPEGWWASHRAHAGSCGGLGLWLEAPRLSNPPGAPHMRNAPRAGPPEHRNKPGRRCAVYCLRLARALGPRQPRRPAQPRAACGCGGDRSAGPLEPAAWHRRAPP